LNLRILFLFLFLFLLVLTSPTFSIKHVTDVFAIIYHLTNVGVVHDIVVIIPNQSTVYTFFYLFSFKFFDAFLKSLDFIIEILLGPLIKLIRRDDCFRLIIPRRDWLASGEGW
jgi:hypothetical protein